MSLTARTYLTPNPPPDKLDAPKALVIGYGSIGARHARVLAGLGCPVAVVSSRSGVYKDQFTSIAEGVKKWRPNYALICSQTSRHHGAFQELSRAGFHGRILVEKPLWSPADAVTLEGFPAEYRSAVVAYPFRFDPLMLKLKELLADEVLISIEIRACSHLPDWRPARDYRSTESALLSAGGGVLRDMSHEMDNALWLAGPWLRVAALGGKLSHLEIETDDAWILLAETKKCPLLSISLNYVDRYEERRIVINTRRCTIKADLLQHTLVAGRETVFHGAPGDTDQMYVTENQALLSGKFGAACTLEEGLEVVKLIGAVERAAEEKRWVTL